MAINSYQDAKDFIFTKLNKAGSPLARTKIAQEIEALQRVIASVDHEMLKTILSVEEFENLSHDDWQRMSREFEIHFDVEMKHGSLIQGNEQQKRDTTWWTDIYKQKSANFYWERYRKYIGSSLPPDVVKTIDNDTDIVMNNLENPMGEPFARYGMVVGHVQSGKTGNYSALICKAADAGYKFIVVIAGGINNLRDQTQERLNESFIGQNRGVQVGAGIGNTQRETMPLSLTTIESDFNKQDADRAAHGFNFETINVPVLLVIKKNTRTLDNVIDWLTQQYKGKGIDHAMLVIDDESDYASINTKGEDNPTAINLKLRTLLSFFNKYAYVAYTATPYANIFIDHEASHQDVGRDLFPKDFIYALDAPSNYFGARKIFIENADKYLVPITDNETAMPYSHKKDFTLDILPASLLQAIRLFILNISVRNLRGQRGKHNSMLIHATRFTDVHRLLAALTEEYLNSIKKDITAYASLPDALDQSVILRLMKDTFEKYLSGKEFGWDLILTELPVFAESIVVREVHQKKSVPLEYRKDQGTNAIVIGGASLARGYTVEGLNVSYFLRNTIFYDTLMQMGRWFGYRPGYEDICKIFMPADRITDFANIIEATETLILDFKLMAEQKKTPNDFGLAIQQNPDSALQVTARNKQNNVTDFPYSMRLDGTLKETSYLRKDAESVIHNLNAIKNLIDVLPAPVKTDGTIVWKNINKKQVQGFLKDFLTFDKDPLGLTSRMPVAFIKKYLDERDTEWDVALYSGSSENKFEYKRISISKQIRQIKAKSDCFEIQNRQVSSGSAEAVTIDNEQVRLAVKNNRRLARDSAERPRPILMLHVLETEPVNDPFIPEIAAFGISFNGSVLTDAPTVRMLINTVYYQNLFDSLNFDNDSDD
jgi:hypothetical protein